MMARDCRCWLGILGLALLPCVAPVPAVAQTDSAPISWSRVLDQQPDWYAGAEAVRVADNVLLYQHENGGWAKNVDMARVLTGPDRGRILEGKDEGGTTIDNGATFTQLRFLARVQEVTGSERFRQAVLNGVDFLLEAQYANGGWPQFYPIRDGYYEDITFNDGAMMGVMRLLRDVAEGRDPFAFVDVPRRERAATAIAKGLEVILKTQIEVDGRRTAWCAQYDPVELSCAKARAYELRSLSGDESVGIVEYLMEIADPGPEIVLAVESAVRWLEEVELTGIALVDKADSTLPGGYDLVVIADPAATPLWARFYEIGTNRPIFVGRDGIVHDSLSQIEHERRIGYSYLGSWPRGLLKKEYPAWERATGGAEGQR